MAVMRSVVSQPQRRGGASQRALPTWGGGSPVGVCTAVHECEVPKALFGRSSPKTAADLLWVLSVL